MRSLSPRTEVPTTRLSHVRPRFTGGWGYPLWTGLVRRPLRRCNVPCPSQDPRPDLDGRGGWMSVYGTLGSPTRPRPGPVQVSLVTEEGLGWGTERTNTPSVPSTLNLGTLHCRGPRPSCPPCSQTPPPDLRHVCGQPLHPLRTGPPVTSQRRSGTSPSPESWDVSGAGTPVEGRGLLCRTRECQGRDEGQVEGGGVGSRLDSCVDAKVRGRVTGVPRVPGIRVVGWSH